MKNSNNNEAGYVRSVPDDAHLVHTAVYEMRWCDMDAFGHVNNAMYFSYFEQARVDWVRAVGVVHGMVLANISCTFIKPLKFPASLEVQMYAGRPGNSSLDTWYEIRDRKDINTLATIGHGKVVWYDQEKDSTVKIPQKILASLEHPNE